MNKKEFKFVNNSDQPMTIILPKAQDVCNCMSLHERLKDLKVAAGVAIEALTWAQEMFISRDQMNAKVHCAPVQLSPITDRVIMARSGLVKALNK